MRVLKRRRVLAEHLAEPRTAADALAQGLGVIIYIVLEYREE